MIQVTRPFLPTAPIRESISRKIVCLPQFLEMTLGQQDFVIERINNA